MAEEHGVLEAEQHRLLQNRDARLRLQSLSWDSAACKEGKKKKLAPRWGESETCILQQDFKHDLLLLELL